MRFLNLWLLFATILVIANVAESVAGTLFFTRMLNSAILGRENIANRYHQRMVDDGATGHLHLSEHSHLG